MKKIHGMFDKLYKMESLKRFKPAIQMADDILFGTAHTTKLAPHMVDNNDIKRYMTMVILALMPSTLASIYFYGWRALAIILTSYMAGAVVEIAFAIVKGEEVHEGFLVTGLIFPLVLPPTVPLWVVAVGVIVATFFGKEVFGGTGRNIFNPALVGRIFITIAFPVIMSAYWVEPLTSGLGGFLQWDNIDAIVSATPLSTIKTGVKSFAELGYSPLDLLLGGAPGSMGETFRLGIIIGGVFLIVTKVADWRTPVSYLGTVAVIAAIGNQFLPKIIAPPLLQLLTGGLLFGAFFMATDPVSSAYTKKGKWIQGICLGLLTVLIRSFTGYVEGTMFSIIIMNAVTPLIDTLVVQSKYKPIQK